MGDNILLKGYSFFKITLPCITVGLLVSYFFITFSVSVSIVLACGVVVTYLFYKMPELGILSIVVLVCSLIFEKDLPLIGFGFGSFQISDVILMILLFKAVVNVVKDKQIRFFQSPLEKPLLLFLLITVYSAFNSIVNYGVDVNDVFRLLRVTSYYLLFYIVTHLITTTKQIKYLIIALCSIAVIVVIAMLIQTVVGESIELIPGGLKAAGGLDEEYNSLRLQPPGQTLLYVSFVTAIYFYVFHKDKAIFSRYFFITALLGLGVMLTYVRTYLVTIVMSTALFLFLAKHEDRKRLLTLVTGNALALCIIVMLFGAGTGKLENMWYAVSHRYSTLFAGDDLIQSNSLNDRRLENGWAIEQIVTHPVLGIGLGKDYRPQIYGSKDEITYYVHNVYLWLMMDMGGLGFVFFIWFYAAFWVRAIKTYKIPEDIFLRSVATGSMLAGFGMFPMAFVIPLFMEWHSIVIIAILMGLSEAIILNSDVHIEDRLNLAANPNRSVKKGQ